MIKMNKETMIISGAIGTLGVMAITGAGLALRGGAKAKKAIGKVSGLNKEIKELTKRIDSLTEAKINADRLNKAEDDIRELKDFKKEMENTK